MPVHPKYLARLRKHARLVDLPAVEDALAQRRITLLQRSDADYPAMLNAIYDPPEFLFFQGTLASGPAVAVVGSRSATPYGETAARSIVSGLAAAEVHIVSGLAQGIDEIAHRAAMEERGRTTAVLGWGLCVYPGRREQRLLEDILANGGCIVSEFAPGMHASKFTFPIRNRIISGLADATLVVEGRQQSGSLITAKSALEQGRDVFAVPGPITAATSGGTNNLLRDGAHLATDANDILFALGLRVPPPLPGRSKNRSAPPAHPLLTHIPATGITTDELCERSDTPLADLLPLLTTLELDGHVRTFDGRWYCA